MRINAAVAFTAILLALMVGAGIVSASWGYALGHQALMGVRQPDSRPNSSSANRAGGGSGQGVTFRSEQDILNEVRTRTSGSSLETDATAN